LRHGVAPTVDLATGQAAHGNLAGYPPFLFSQRMAVRTFRLRYAATSQDSGCLLFEGVSAAGKVSPTNFRALSGTMSLPVASRRLSGTRPAGYKAR
jgi:hypothetical protein